MGYRADALENDSTAPQPFVLPNIGLDEAPLFVQYRNSTAFWFTFSAGPSAAGTGVTTFDVANQHEILLFTRDPAEQSASIRSNVDLLTDISTDDAPGGFPASWTFFWDPTLVPMAGTIMYPPHAGWQTVTPLNNPVPTPILVSSIQSSNFWGTSAPMGPGATPSSINTLPPTVSPDTSGSIKAAKVLNHGLCARTLPYLAGTSSSLPPLFPLAAKALPAFLKASSCNQLAGMLGNLEVRWLSLGSFLDFTQSQEDRQIGGFFLNFNFQANIVFNGGPNVLSRTQHTFRLFNGRLTTDSAWVDGEWAGTGSTDVVAGLLKAFTQPMSRPIGSSDVPQTLAEAIYQVADEQLVFPSKALQVTCSQRAGGDDTIIASPPNASDTQQCGNFIADFFNNPINGLNPATAAASTNPVLKFFGVNLTSHEVTEINETVLAIEPASHTWRNFRCAQFANSGSPPGTPNAGRCQYVLPVKRLNVYPDGVESVFLDEPKELNNPVYAVWLVALNKLVSNGDNAFYSGLCDPPLVQSPGSLSNRAYAEFPPLGSPLHDTHFDGCIVASDGSCSCACSGSNNDCP